MAETRKAKNRERVVDIRCKAIIPPPGTKNHNRLPREGDPEPSQIRRYLLLAGLLVAVLAVGMAVGRFLLP